MLHMQPALIAYSTLRSNRYQEQDDAYRRMLPLSLLADSDKRRLWTAQANVSSASRPASCFIQEAQVVVVSADFELEQPSH